jgi:uncharacterized protein YciI
LVKPVILPLGYARLETRPLLTGSVIITNTLIIAHDHPGMDAKREELREAHRAHLAAQGTKLLVSGALLSGDSNKIEGGASLLDTEDFDEAVRFEAQDPYAKAGIRARVEIVKWRLRWWIGQFKTEGHHPSRD